MSQPCVITMSLSEIGSSVFAKKLRIIYHESLGAIHFINIDVKAAQTRTFKPNSVIILNLPEWSTETDATITTLRDRGFRGQILAVVKDLGLWPTDSLDPVRYKAVTFLERPFQDSELIGLVRRMLAIDTPSFRSHPRYDLDQQAELQVDGRMEGVRTCVVKNVSLGGACLEFKGEIPVVAGHFITLNVNLGQTNEAHALRGRVAWVQPFKALAGVEFVGTLSV